MDQIIGYFKHGYCLQGILKLRRNDLNLDPDGDDLNIRNTSIMRYNSTEPQTAAWFEQININDRIDIKLNVRYV